MNLRQNIFPLHNPHVLHDEPPHYTVGNLFASKHLVVICHDESSFQSNDDQKFAWTLPDQTAIKPKSRGS